MDALEKLLACEGPELFKQAREMAKTKDTVFGYPITVNTACKMNPHCRHCHWRSMFVSNDEFRHLGARKEAAIANAREFEVAGAHRLHLTSGWMGEDLPAHYYELVQAIRENTKLELYGFFGPINQQSIARLKDCGIDGILCPMEVINPETFKKIRPGDSYQARLNTLCTVKDMGLKLWSGFIYGFGKTPADISFGLKLMKEHQVDSVSISCFTPNPFTAMEKENPPNLYTWAKIIAAARIYLETADIFIKPDIAQWGLRAGANGILPIVPKNLISQIAELKAARQNLNDMEKG